MVQPREAENLGLPRERFAENQLRPASKIMKALLALGPEPLSVARGAGQRAVGTCRHFAALSCALLRCRDIPGRARCGFATYFQRGQSLDHWVTEYWNNDRTRWTRIDSEIVGKDVLPHPEDPPDPEFLSGGEAWRRI